MFTSWWAERVPRGTRPMRSHSMFFSLRFARFFVGLWPPPTCYLSRSCKPTSPRDITTDDTTSVLYGYRYVRLVPTSTTTTPWCHRTHVCAHSIHIYMGTYLWGSEMSYLWGRWPYFLGCKLYVIPSVLHYMYLYSCRYARALGTHTSTDYHHTTIIIFNFLKIYWQRSVHTHTVDSILFTSKYLGADQ